MSAGGRVLRLAGLTAALILASASSFYLGRASKSLDPPGTLIGAGVHAAFAENEKLLADIREYQASSELLASQLAESRDREAQHRRRAAKALSQRDEVMARADELEKREPEVRQDVAEAEKVLERFEPEGACRPLYAQVVKLEADVKWGLELVEARDAELAALTGAFDARAAELKDVQFQRDALTDRLDEADGIIRKAKRASKRTRLVGIAMIGAGVLLAAK